MDEHSAGGNKQVEVAVGSIFPNPDVFHDSEPNFEEVALLSPVSGVGLLS